MSVRHPRAPDRRRRTALLRAAVVAVTLALAPAGAAAAPAATGSAPAERAGPLKLVVSLQDQTMRVFRGTEVVLSTRVSTGREGYATPAGIFSILEKRRWHRSNIYSRAPMPFMQRLTWSGIALHAGVVPDRPASHGCIRLPDETAVELFALTERGAHVIVTENGAEPFPMAHPNLVDPFAPAPAGGPGTEPAPRPPAAAAALADTDMAFEAARAFAARAGAPLRILLTRRNGRERLVDVQTLLAGLGYDPGPVDGYMGPKTARAVRAFQAAQDLPASGIVTGDTVTALFRAAGRGEPPDGHIYVRQGFRELFDAPATLRDPDGALGTHIFLAAPGAAGGVEWTGLTVQAAGRTAGDALGAFELPAGVRARLGRLLTPGSSLIVSDEGLGRETGRGTDFIVLVQ